MFLLDRVRPTVLVMTGAGAAVSLLAIRKLAESTVDTEAQIVTVATALIGTLLALGRDIITGESKELNTGFFARFRPTISIITIMSAIVAKFAMDKLADPDYTVTVAMAFSIAVVSLGRDIVASESTDSNESETKEIRETREKPVPQQNDQQQSKERKQGRITNLPFERDFGFIESNDGGEKLFFHETWVADEKFRDLQLNDVVEYTPQTNMKDGRPIALKVTLINSELDEEEE